MVLEEAFIQKCREAFNTFDADGSGTIDTQGIFFISFNFNQASKTSKLRKKEAAAAAAGVD